MQTSVRHTTCWSTRGGGSRGSVGCGRRCILIVTTAWSAVMVGKMTMMAIELMLAVMMTVWYWWSWLRCLCSLSLCIATWSRRCLMEEIHFIAGGKTDTCAWYSGCTAATWKEYFSSCIGGTMYWTRGAGWRWILENGSTCKLVKNK